MSQVQMKFGGLLGLASLAFGLAACDQPMAVRTGPQPLARIPEARDDRRAAEERELAATLRALVAFSNTAAGREALLPAQQAAESRLSAALAAPRGSAERMSLDELVARLRAATVVRPGQR